MTTHLKPLTRDDIFRMSETEITAYWVARQREAKSAGLPYYERLVDAITGTVYATVEGD